VHCFGFRFSGFGLRVEGFGLRGVGAGLRMQGSRLKVVGEGLRVEVVSEAATGASNRASLKTIDPSRALGARI